MKHAKDLSGRYIGLTLWTGFELSSRSISTGPDEPRSGISEEQR
jgi:hypothetical protein